MASTKNIHELLCCTYIWDTVQEKGVWHKIGKMGSFILLLLYTHTETNLMKLLNKISIALREHSVKKKKSTLSKKLRKFFSATNESLAMEFCTLLDEDF